MLLTQAQLTASANVSVPANSHIFATASSGFNRAVSFLLTGIVANSISTLTGGFAGTDPNVTVNLEPKSNFTQHRMYQPLPLALLSAWPLDPSPIVFNPGVIATSSIGGQGTMIGLTPHQYSLNPLKAFVSGTNKNILLHVGQALQTASAGELVYSTKPTIFYGGLVAGNTISRGGYNAALASAQYHRHTYPYNTPFYATDKIRNDVPNYDTYAQFSDLVKESGRDFSIVPEFNISDHMQHYSSKIKLNEIRDAEVYAIKEVQSPVLDIVDKKLFLPSKINIGSKLKFNLKYLSLDGADITSSSPNQTYESAGLNQFGNLLRYDDVSDSYVYKAEQQNHVDRIADIVKFNQKYSNTEDITNFSNLTEASNILNSGTPSEIVFTCKAVKKGRIRNGFFPVTRTLQIVKDFEKSIFRDNPDKPVGINMMRAFSSDSQDITLAAAYAKQAVIEPLFAPGILYNSIKAGIAVDWPIYTDFANGQRRPPIYYAPQHFVSASSMFQSFHARGNSAPGNENRVNNNASSSFNYGGFQMIGASRCIPAILNNIPLRRLPFKALYDYSVLDNIAPGKADLYLPTDFVDLDRSHVFSHKLTNTRASNDPRHLAADYPSGKASQYSLPFLTNSIHPGYAFPTGLPRNSDPKHPGARLTKEFATQFNENSNLYLYFSSINNYLAETMNFFLDDSDEKVPGLKLPVILPSTNQAFAGNINFLDAGPDSTKPYYMTINLSMGKRQVNAEGPRDSGNPRNRKSIFTGSFMRGYIYGPPIEIVPHQSASFAQLRNGRALPYGQAIDTISDSAEIVNLRVVGSSSAWWEYEDYFSYNLQDPAYQAYTPPYFYGDSNYVLKFTLDEAPVGQAGLQPFEDVWSFATEEGAFYFDQYHTGSAQKYNTASFDLNGLCNFLPSTSSVSAGSFSRMKLDASVEISRPIDVTKGAIDFSTAYIAPWWTCPVLDFSSSYAAVLTGSTNDDLTVNDDQFHGAGSLRYSTVNNTYHSIKTGRGLWGGYGTDPYDRTALEAVRDVDPATSDVHLNEKGVYLSIVDNFSGDAAVRSQPEIITNSNTLTPILPEVDGYFSSVGSKSSATNTTGSLAEKLSFSTNKKYPIGKMASSKTLSEAIVVIPYLEDPIRIVPRLKTFESGLNINFDEGKVLQSGLPSATSMEVQVGDLQFGQDQLIPGDEAYHTREIIPGKHFLPIQKSLFQRALSNVLGRKYLDPDQQVGVYGLQEFNESSFNALLSTDVGKMIDTLTGYSTNNSLLKHHSIQYQMPPEFDFIHNSNIDPFQMIIIPFQHEFNKQDLLDIYQNINPRITKKIETAINEIVIRPQGLEGLEQATWMPKIYTQSLQYLKDLEYPKTIN